MCVEGVGLSCSWVLFRGKNRDSFLRRNYGTAVKLLSCIHSCRKDISGRITYLPTAGIIIPGDILVPPNCCWPGSIYCILGPIYCMLGSCMPGGIPGDCMPGGCMPGGCMPGGCMPGGCIMD
jgi:hypothetical protein